MRTGRGRDDDDDDNYSFLRLKKSGCVSDIICGAAEQSKLKPDTIFERAAR